MNKKLLIVSAAACFAAACGKKAEQAPEHQTITTLAPDFELNDKMNATVIAEFTADNFNWMGGNLTMRVFAQDFYDAKLIESMKKGDTIMYEGLPIAIDTIVNADGLLTINDGPYNEEGNGCDLVDLENGRYTTTIADDYPTMTEVGTIQVPLADNFVLIDCHEDPLEPYDTITTGQKQYIESLEDYRREFISLNTLVTLKNGVITKIVRNWIP